MVEYNATLENIFAWKKSFYFLRILVNRKASKAFGLSLCRSALLQCEV